MASSSYVSALEAFAKATAETLDHEALRVVIGSARLSFSLGGHSHEWANMESALNLLNHHRFPRESCCGEPIFGGSSKRDLQLT
jgi:hypothetical protein